MKGWMLGLIFLLYGCSKPDTWMLYYYKDRNNVPSALEAQNHIKGRFTTFHDCQTAAVALIRETMDDADYECSLNCEYDVRLGLDICEETRK